MTSIVVIVLAAVALLAIALCVVLAMRMSKDSGNLELESTRRQLDEAMRHIAELTSRIEQNAAEERRAAIEERRMAAEERRAASSEFRSAAREAMQESSQTLRSANVHDMTALLTPLRDQLGEFRRAVNDSYVNENASRRSLADQIERLMQLNLSIGEEARNLTEALKGNSKVQGDWGEMILVTLLENAGMKNGVNFFTQVAADEGGSALRDAETGRGLRPDVVVSLPDGHRMVVDSKVSLTAFAEYHQARDKQAVEAAGRRHLLSVKKHINELAEKRYQDVINSAAEHVLMFIPNEGAFMLAQALDPMLWKYAYERNVVITSPTHLFSVLQIVSQLWREENQNRNAMEIARQGGALYDKIVSFMTAFSSLESSLERTQRACAEVRHNLSGTNQSLLAKAERLRDLGAKTKRRLSPSDLPPDL